MRAVYRAVRAAAAPVLRLLIALVLAVLPLASPMANVAHAAPCDAPITNPVACENTKPGNPSSQWDISGSGDPSLQGFASDISYNRGDTAHFKVSTSAGAYTITIYRMGYYQGNGARQIAAVSPSATLPQTQPACFTDNSVGLTDCGNWADSATWTIPPDAVSGIYFARLTRTDTGGSSHIVFVVRDDSSTSDVLFQTDDPTWQAYNQYGGSSTYQSNLAQGRAYKVSYNRPFATRGQAAGFGTANWVFYAEYPMVRWLELNGYNLSYFSGLDADRRGSLIKNHKVFLSAGHDEYWSAGQRANVEAARDAGVNLAFFSGNLVFWKTRWEASQAGPSTPNRTLVVYKETKEAAPIDPLDPPTWTGTWRDPTWSPPADGGRPENALLGTLFQVNRGSSNISVPSAYSKLRIWRNTAVANLANGASLTLGNPNGSSNVLGYEWDTDVDNGFRPAGTVRLSQTTVSVPELIQDFGNTFSPGTATHYMTEYRAPSGALVFSAGTVQWAWGLDVNHDTSPDIGPATPDTNMQQMTVNILADMGVQPTTLQANLVAGTKSTDTTPPTATLTSPADNASFAVNTSVTISGTASDVGGVVGGVEISTDGGATWHPASGTASWTYTWTPKWGGPANLKVRAADDSGNIQTPGPGITVNITGDTTAPTLTAIAASNITGTNATVTWKTNEPATSQVQYGPTTAYGSTTTLDNTLVFSHSQVLGGLSPSTSYHYRVVSKDAVGNQATSPDQTLTTPAAGTVSLVGEQSLEALVDQEGAGSAEAFQYLASTSGTGNVLYVYIDAANQATKLQVGLYSNSTGNDPGTLLSQATITSPVGGAWNSVTIPSATITAGFKYWIAILSPAGSGTAFFRDTSNGTRNVTTSQTNLAALPPSWSVGPTFSNTPLSAYVGQVGGSTDTTPPVVSITTPAGGATVSGTNVSVTANATDNVAVASVQFLLDGQPLGAVVTSAPYTTTWDTTSATNGAHTLSARATDTSGNVANAATVSVTASNTSAPPVISAVGAGTPQSNTATITWTTDRAASSQVNYGLTSTYGTASPTDPSLVTSHSVSLTGLTPNTTYHYQVASTDAQNAPSISGDFTFTTAPDTTPPTITSVQSTGISNTAATVTWTTDEPADSQVEYGPTTAYGSSTPLSTSLTLSHSVALSGLTGGTTYHFRVKSKDAAANLATSPDFTFTTLATCPCSVWSPATVPTTTAANDSGAVEVGVKFRSDTAGYIYGIRFYKSATNTGAHVGNLWSNTGALLATATFANESNAGWQQVQFSTPVQIQANTTYVASYHTTTGRYSADAGFFGSGANNAPLHALANGTDGPNGVFTYSATSAFPNQSFNSTNYWVDVVYSANATDTIPPFITNVQASSVGITSATITWGTNKNADSQVEYGTTTAYGTSTPVDPTAVVNHTVALGSLTQATTYHYRVKSTDAAGNQAVSGDFTFTTGTPPTCPCSLWSSTATPATAASGDASAVEVGVKFRTDTAGYVNGIRFYKGSANTGRHVGNLWTSTGTLLASATFSGETASGWQQVLFSAPVQVQPNTTYVASYHTTTGNYASDSLAFSSNGIDNGYLHALANGVDGGNGVFIYGGSAFPNQSFNATNYWVDVVFNTNLVDTVPPTLVGQAPAPNATRVSTGAAVLASFSEAINQATMSFVLKDATNAVVASTVTYNAGAKLAALQPNAALSGNTTYTATLSGVTDTAGNPMPAATWSFTTQSCPCSLWTASTSPVTAAANDSQPIEVGVKLRSDVGGYINGIRFYKSTTNTGTHVGHLWSSAGALLATATFAGETASGWQQVLFSAPVQIQANTTYVASYHTDVGQYSADAGYFASASADGGSLHGLANNTDGPNGVYVYGASAFPNQSFNATNYWVDVVFNSTLTDTVAPTITSVKAGGVTSSGATMTWTTDEPSDSLVEYGTTTTYGSSSAPNASMVTSHSVALTGLSGSTLYHYRVKSKDSSGNLATSADFTFTTAAAPATCPCSIWSSTATPATAATADSSAIEVGVKFRSDQAGFITGIRFYKGTTNTGIHVGNLWSSTGALLGTATFANETASGWQQVTFSTAVAIQANTTYMASYHTNVGNYSSTGGGLSSAADNAPLHALANGTDGPNGVFIYSAASAFPTQSFNATNYWVDVVFKQTLP